MEERKHLLAYVEQVFMVFGISIVALSAICVVAGEEAREISTMFALGAEGIPLSTLGQYLLSSLCITALRFVFFTDALIRRWTLAARTAGMLVAVTVLTGGLAYLFGWFPVNEPICWVAFLVSFGVCFITAAVFSAKKERAENRQLENALRRMKEKQGCRTEENRGKS